MLLLFFDLCFRSGSVEVKAVGVSSPPVDTAQHQTAAAKQKQKPQAWEETFCSIIVF